MTNCLINKVEFLITNYNDTDIKNKYITRKDSLKTALNQFLNIKEGFDINDIYNALTNINSIVISFSKIEDDEINNMSQNIEALIIKIMDSLNEAYDNNEIEKIFSHLSLCLNKIKK